MKAIKEGVKACTALSVKTLMKASETSDADAQAIVAYVRPLKK